MKQYKVYTTYQATMWRNGQGHWTRIAKVFWTSGGAYTHEQMMKEARKTKASAITMNVYRYW